MYRSESKDTSIFLVQYNADAHNTHAHSLMWTPVRKLYPYEYLRRTGPADLEIPEVTIDASLSTEKNNMVGDTYYTHSTIPYLIS